MQYSAAPFKLKVELFFTPVTKLNRPDGTTVIVSHQGLWISLTYVVGAALAGAEP